MLHNEICITAFCIIRKRYKIALKCTSISNPLLHQYYASYASSACVRNMKFSETVINITSHHATSQIMIQKLSYSYIQGRTRIRVEWCTLGQSDGSKYNCDREARIVGSMLHIKRIIALPNSAAICVQVCPLTESLQYYTEHVGGSKWMLH